MNTLSAVGNDVPLLNLVIVFGFVFVVGIILCLPLLQNDYKKSLKTSLFIKIFFWIPIFMVFLAVLYSTNFDRTVFLAVFLVATFLEFKFKLKQAENKIVLYVFFSIFAIGLGHLFVMGYVFDKVFVNLLITLGFATALSDATAYLLGKYWGKHKLPEWINNSKSWEGVVGQLLGSLAGVLLVNYFVEPVVTIWLFAPIGIGCTIGDLANSFAKRNAHTENWSKAIPGHGGFIDRSASVAGSTILMFYFLVLSRLL
jgi:phosphatidate cytidylyltransferase